MTGEVRRRKEIDAVKGIAIIGVILGHAFMYTLSDGSPSSAAAAIAAQSFDLSHILTSLSTFSAFTTQQVVPIFIFLMAVNYTNSFKRRKLTNLKDLYSWGHMGPRLARFLGPFLIAYLLSIAAIAFFLIATGTNYLFLSPWLLIGYLPVNGLGNYFIPLVFEFLLIFPLLFYSFHRRPLATVASLFAIGLLNEFLLSGSYMVYQNTIFRFLPLIGLGMLLCENLTLRGLKNRGAVFLLGSFSAIYLLFIGQFTYPFSFGHIYFMPLLNAQKLFASFYVAIAIAFLLAIFIAAKSAANPLAWIGKRSYSIFLAQILFFGTIAPTGSYSSIGQLLAPGNLVILVADLAVCITMGAILDLVAEKVLTAVASRPKPDRVEGSETKGP